MHPPGEKINNASAVSVRRMTLADVPTALSILKESPEASIWSSESLSESVSRGIAWAAEESGRVAGILIGRVAADEFEILNLAVEKRSRRRGLATQLVTTALEHARTEGAKQTYLEVRDGNLDGIAFYTRLGFNVCGRRPNYYRNPVEDAVLFVLHKNGTIS
jgi:ribosomal-protein-alanine N-acetyltransferase